MFKASTKKKQSKLEDVLDVDSDDRSKQVSSLLRSESRPTDDSISSTSRLISKKKSKKLKEAKTLKSIAKNLTQGKNDRKLQLMMKTNPDLTKEQIAALQLHAGEREKNKAVVDHWQETILKQKKIKR